MRNVVVRDAGVLNIEKLDADIRASAPGFEGLSTGLERGLVTLHFADGTSEEAVATAIGLVRSHDPTALTARQQTEAQLRREAGKVAGTEMDNLALEDIRRLLGLVLWRLGALEADGTVKAPERWGQ